MNTSLSRGAPTFNSLLFKPMIRKSYHKKGGGNTIHREMTSVKSNAEEGLMKKSMIGSEIDGNRSWVPDDRTGIYYPKGHEKVMEDVPVEAAKHTHGVNWFSNNFDA
ncbi:hypothetical protein Dsin_013113 [Dipteronia sinensis]|uniref:Late embryogenesis abundant protein n=1 Tax=Dipteronia sinensis TaxID=43782 RepID=A0AAE0E8K6_9ROSI|nr:hypothetical protein Dsin_013113 [Dipteronia sinensis]